MPTFLSLKILIRLEKFYKHIIIMKTNNITIMKTVDITIIKVLQFTIFNQLDGLKKTV